MAIFKLATYTWRGKTYKNITTLLRKVSSVYHVPGGYGINFAADAMCLIPQQGATLRFARTFDADGNSHIADNPQWYL